MPSSSLRTIAGFVLAGTLAASAVPLSADIIAPEARKAAPRWKLPNLTGGNKQLSDYKGKVVLLNFWATWCAPCKQEIPWFAEFFDKYKADGLEVVGISVDEKGWKVIKPYVDDKANGINYTILHDNVDLTVMYKIQLMPKTILIDRDGKVAAIHNGIVEKDSFEQEIKTVLGRP